MSFASDLFSALAGARDKLFEAAAHSDVVHAIETDLNQLGALVSHDVFAAEAHAVQLLHSLYSTKVAADSTAPAAPVADENPQPAPDTAPAEPAPAPAVPTSAPPAAAPAAEPVTTTAAAAETSETAESTEGEPTA